uniref:Uncharacterized protein n=1 Tax=Panagrolaimus superbus TaxID=310955 RepID=A0A914YSQ4_9BILA
MLAILGIEFQPSSQVFWHSSYMVNEVKSTSFPVLIQDMGPERNFGFQAFSLFLTSSEETAFRIQEFVKRYIYKSYYNAAAQELESYNTLMKSALCSFNLENIHLWVVTKILNVRIVVFDEEEIQVYGDTFNNSVPSILLKKNGEKFWPVLNVHYEGEY